MSYVNPVLRSRLDAMPDPVQRAVLSMDVKLETTADLITCLERLAHTDPARKSAVRSLLRAYSGRYGTS